MRFENSNETDESQDPVLTPEEKKLMAEWSQKSWKFSEQCREKSRIISNNHPNPPESKKLTRKSQDKLERTEADYRKRNQDANDDYKEGKIDLKTLNFKLKASQKTHDLEVAENREETWQKSKGKKNIEAYQAAVDVVHTWEENEREKITTPEIKNLIRKQLQALLPQLEAAGLTEQIGDKKGPLTVDEVICSLSRCSDIKEHFKGEKELFKLDLDEDGIFTLDEVVDRMKNLPTGRAIKVQDKKTR